MTVTDAHAETPAASVLEALGRYDTPTICNALELVAPERRLTGYTTRRCVCPFPDLPPIVGYARTADHPRDGHASERARRGRRRCGSPITITSAPGRRPRISVIQDLDGAQAGFGAFWGEVHSAIHKALGCLGVVTDGSIRDIPQWAPGFQALAGMVGPSHAHVHLVDFGEEVRVARHDCARRATSSTPTATARS